MATIFWKPSTPAAPGLVELGHAARGDPLEDLVLAEPVGAGAETAARELRQGSRRPEGLAERVVGGGRGRGAAAGVSASGAAGRRRRGRSLRGGARCPRACPRSSGRCRRRSRTGTSGAATDAALRDGEGAASASAWHGRAWASRMPDSVSRRRRSTVLVRARARRGRGAGTGRGRGLSAAEVLEHVGEDVRGRQGQDGSGCVGRSASSWRPRPSIERGPDRTPGGLRRRTDSTRMSKAPTFWASAFGLEPLYPVIMRRIGGAVAPPFFRISRMTSALGSRGSIPAQQDEVEARARRTRRALPPRRAPPSRRSPGAARGPRTRSTYRGS